MLEALKNFGTMLVYHAEETQARSLPAAPPQSGRAAPRRAVPWLAAPRAPVARRAPRLAPRRVSRKRRERLSAG